MALVSDEEWAEFKQKFEKEYKEEDEDKMRRVIFAKSKAEVEEHNKKYAAGEVTWTMGINHLSDLTKEEFQKMLGFGTKPPPVHP